MEGSLGERKGFETLEDHVRDAILLALAHIIQGHLELLGKMLDRHGIRTLFGKEHLDIDNPVVIVRVDGVVCLDVAVRDIS